jgi:hypothetical protein
VAGAPRVCKASVSALALALMMMFLGTQ